MSNIKKYSGVRRTIYMTDYTAKQLEELCEWHKGSPSQVITHIIKHAHFYESIEQGKLVNTTLPPKDV